MPDGSVLVLVMFPPLGCFLAYQVGENHLCMSHKQSQFGHFSGYQSKKCVEILELPFTPRCIKKQVTPSWPLPSASHWFLLLPSPSLSVACYRCTTKDIFEKRNVHECLQCPPHWNTWGKVSSLTLWSIPAPQLEPQRLVPLLMRIFFSGWWANFSHEDSRCHIGTILNWLGGYVHWKIYNRILDLWFWISDGVVVVGCHCFKFQSFYGSRDCWGGRGAGFWGREGDGFLRCIVIKAS